MDNNLKSLFSFHPDKKAKRERLREEARGLYRAGVEGARLQPVYDSYEGLLGKFYLYPTFRCPLRCPYCYAEGGDDFKRCVDFFCPGRSDEAIGGYIKKIYQASESHPYSTIPNICGFSDDNMLEFGKKEVSLQTII